MRGISRFHVSSQLRASGIGASVSHAAWDSDAVDGMHAMPSANIPRSMGC
jgi:hypothetical protein